MRKPPFKKYLSYFSDIVLEETSSDYNPILLVALSKGRYQLCTDEAIYSFDDKYDNFRTAFDKIDLPQKPIDNCLLLGLGLGSIPFMIEKIYNCKYNYTAVEIDPIICKLADKYVLSDLNAQIQIFPIDADHYFKWNDQKFDLIAMDIFQSAEIPEKFQTLDFLKNLKDHLTENGILLYNRLAENEQHMNANDNFLKKWNSVFANGSQIFTKNNSIFINDENHIVK